MFFSFFSKEIDENLNFDEQILEAAKSIMNAAGALINAPTSAQKEIATQVKVCIGRINLCLLSIFENKKKTSSQIPRCSFLC